MEKKSGGSSSPLGTLPQPRRPRNFWGPEGARQPPELCVQPKALLENFSTSYKILHIYWASYGKSDLLIMSTCLISEKGKAKVKGKFLKP